MFVHLLIKKRHFYCKPCLKPFTEPISGILDLSPTFRSFARETFQNARLVADRFHVQRLFIRLVNKFRREATGDKRSNPIRKLLLRNAKKLKPYQRKVIGTFLNFHPRLREVYEIKESLHRLYRIRGKKRAETALNGIIYQMGMSKVEGLVQLRSTIVSWKNEILEYFDGRFSNGRVEGFNRNAKLVQRRAYGFRSFQNYRLQLLHACRGRVS